MSTKTVQKTKRRSSRTRERSLQAVVQRLIVAGGALSNIAYNLKQRKDLSPELTATLEEWQGKWDAARTEMHKLTEAKGLTWELSENLHRSRAPDPSREDVRYMPGSRVRHARPLLFLL